MSIKPATDFVFGSSAGSLCSGHASSILQLKQARLWVAVVGVPEPVAAFQEEREAHCAGASFAHAEDAGQVPAVLHVQEGSQEAQAGKPSTLNPGP